MCRGTNTDGFRRMRHLDLFSGIGGFALAVEEVWGTDVEHIFCDIEPFSQRILAKHWPNSLIYGDIRELRGSEVGQIDILTGGFPCQPFSVAGKRRGKGDDRDLWPEMFRLIQETRPTWVLGENVAGFVGMELDRSLSDLEGIGYSVQAFDIPALAAQAPQIRHRTWIVAHSNFGQRVQSYEEVCARRDAASPGSKDISDTHSIGLEGSTKGQVSGEQELPKEPLRNGQDERRGWPTEPELGRVAHGIPDRAHRIKSLGNAIVPQVAAEIMRAMKRTNNIKLYV